jgi:CHAT domain-containing protein/Tfp pilus assembly protein PilF
MFFQSRWLMILASIVFVLLIEFARVAEAASDVVEVQLSPGMPVNGRLAGSTVDKYILSVLAGEYFEIHVDRIGMVVDVGVYSPAGELVTRGDGDWESRSTDLIGAIAKESGSYRVEIRLMFPQARGGSYQIRLETVRAPRALDQPRLAGIEAYVTGHRRRTKWTEQPDEAIADFERAVAHWRSAADESRVGMAYSSIASVYRNRGNLRKATEYFEKALAIYQAQKVNALEIDAMTDLVYTYAKQGQVLRAVALANESLTLAKARSDTLGQCRALALLGGVSNAAGNAQAGREYGRQALPLCHEAPSPFGERLALMLIADSYAYLGEPQEALKYFNQALDIVTPAFDAYAQGYIRLNLARLRLQMGERQEALSQAQQSLTQYQHVGQRDGEGNARLMLGKIYIALGDESNAKTSFQQALELGQTTGDLILRAQSLQELAGISIRTSRHSEAENYLAEATEALKEKSIPTIEIEVAKQMARLDQMRGRPAKALSSLQNALGLSQKLELAAHETEILWMLGTTYLAMQEFSSAKEPLQQALSKAREKRLPDFEIQALGGLARLATMQGNDEQAQRHLEAALTLIETSRARIVSPDFRVTFFAASQAFYEDYIDVLMKRHEERQEKENCPYLALALQAVERARARSLLELLTEAHINIREGIEPALLERERVLQQRLSAKAERLWLAGQSGRNPAQLAALRTEMDAIVLEQRELAAQIRERSPRYAALRQPQPLSLKEIQSQVLDPETLLLEYKLGERRSYLFAVTSTEIKSWKLPARADIESLSRRILEVMEATSAAKTFNTLVEKRSYEQRLERECQEASKALSRVLLAPVAEMMNNKRLLIVGDGMLQYLPFSALNEPAESHPQPGRKKRAPSPWQPLIVAHEILRAPSASTLAVMRQELKDRPLAPKTVAVLADPVFGKNDRRLPRVAGILARQQSGAATPSFGNHDFSQHSIASILRMTEADLEEGPELPRLPATRREAEAILALVPAPQRIAALDFDASLANATSPVLREFRYLHIATHGQLNHDHPELSGLVLSLVDRSGKSQEGILRATDVYNLKLPVELAVLSGCRTALGHESNGEGLMGLTRGFFYAGARRIVASIWKVDDRATADLMRHFYQEMLGPKQLSPSAALRAAKISMLKDSKWHAPWHWAAFTLQGEW